MLKNDFKKIVEGKKLFIVTFTKKDGTERVMEATIDMNKIPTDDHPAPKEMTEEMYIEWKAKDDASPYLNVYDLEKGQWRKVNIETVTSLLVKYI